MRVPAAVNKAFALAKPMPLTVAAHMCSWRGIDVYSAGGDVKTMRGGRRVTALHTRDAIGKRVGGKVHSTSSPTLFTHSAVSHWF